MTCVHKHTYYNAFVSSIMLLLLVVCAPRVCRVLLEHYRASGDVAAPTELRNSKRKREIERKGKRRRGEDEKPVTAALITKAQAFVLSAGKRASRGGGEEERMQNEADMSVLLPWTGVWMC